MAFALERRGRRAIAVAARRVGAGRVMQIGYDDSWRWRMAGGARDRSARIASGGRASSASVAYAPRAAATGDGRRDRGAPLAALVDRLGPARAARAGQRASRRRRSAAASGARL